MIIINALDKRKSTCELPFRGASPASSSAFVGGCCYADNNINSDFGQYSEITELQDKFVPKKLNNILLYNSYSRLGFAGKAKRVSECGSFLSFAHEIDENGVISENGKLHLANFCKDRLCPMCSWRRSYKIFSQVSQIMARIHKEYKFLFLTLTIPNVEKSELNSSIDHLMSSWNRFSAYKPIKKILKGYFRALEITYNKEQDTFHPHFHVVLAVPLSYLTSRDYIQRDTFLALWQKATRDASISQVDIRVCKDKYSNDELKASSALSSAVAEVAKYAVKSSDYLLEDESLTDELVYTFSEALYHRRLAQFGGIFKETFKRLHFEDTESEDADLVHIQDKLNPSLAWLICRFGWSMGAYKMLGSFIESADRHIKS